MRQWSNHHDHLAAFHFREVLNLADLLGVFCHALQQFTPKVLVGHFATAETQRDFHLVAIFQEFENVPHLDVIVIGVGVGSEFDLFDFDYFLLFSGFAFAFLLLILELTEIHYFADRRTGIRRNFYKIQSCLVSELHGARGADNADIVAIGANQTNFGGADLIVYARAGVALRRRIVGSSGDGSIL